MRRLISWALPVAFALALAPAALAQGPGMGGPGGQGGMPSLPPEAMAKIKAWQKWGESHKNFQPLMATLMGLGALEQDPKTRLTKPQAQKILAVLKAWRHKPVMTNDQALEVNKQLTAPLNLQQLKKLAAMQTQRGRRGAMGGGMGGGMRGGGMGGGMRGGGMGGGGGMGAPRAGGEGGQGGPGGGRSPSDFFSRMPGPKEYNPLNPESSPWAQAAQRGGNGGGGGRFAAGMRKRYDDFIKTLEQRAK